MQRRPRAELDLLLGERRVVPGGATTAWVVVRDRATGAPLVGDVEVRLLEGHAERHRARARTDAGGTAMFRVPVPRSRERGRTWTRAGELAAPGGAGPAKATATLTTREETPGKPQVLLSLAESARPGASVDLGVRLRDAADHPLAGHEVRVWAGPRAAPIPEPGPAWRAA